MVWVIAAGFVALVIIGNRLEKRFAEISRNLILVRGEISYVGKNLRETHELIEEIVYPEGRLNALIQKMAESCKKPPAASADSLNDVSLGD